MINIENLTKTFAERVALKGISFRVGKGEIAGFLGPNGAGKTTTMRILTGFIPATSGKVEVAGYDVFEKPIEVKRRVGYMPESVPLYPEMRVSEYLAFRAAIKGIPRSRRLRQIDKAIELCHLVDARRRIIGQLSKGYRQRVGLADAILADPPLLVLDEPTIGLDPHQVRQVRSLIRAMASEHTILLSTHILPEAETLCSRILIINQGTIVGEGKPEDLRKGVHGGVVLVVQGRGDGVAAQRSIEAIPGVRTVEGPEPHADEPEVFVLKVTTESETAVREAIFRAASEGGWVLRGLESVATSLEDVFVHITMADDAAVPEGEEPKEPREGSA